MSRAVDPTSPVLVGAGQVARRPDDAAPVEAAVLMADAVRAAVADADPVGGPDALLCAVDAVWVPGGTWGYADAARLVADRLGMAGVATARFDVGMTQQAMLTAAALAVAEGRREVVVVVGGEARLHARASGVGDAVPETGQPDGTAPDEVVAPADLGVHDLEIERDIVTPTTGYALVEHAVGHAAGEEPGRHRLGVGALWARFAEVAAANPYAWDRGAPTTAEILAVGPDNRPIADPYPKRLCSQWNVDQAAAVILCSAATAQRLGVARERWVFPHASTVADHAVPLLQRAELHRCLGAELAGPRCVELAGATVDALGPVDLYSCFPAAVQLYAGALGLPLDDPARPLTTTGGMTFAGGPLNSYVLHALAAMVPQLRGEPSRLGLSTSVSVVVTKQGFGLWGASPPTGGFRHEDCTRAVAVAAAPEVRPVDAGFAGVGTVASWTVTYDGLEPARAVAIVDTPDGARTIAESRDRELASVMAGDRDDWIGCTVEVDDGALHLP
ncbi:MAG: hypothetical protein R2726_03535 [Acidimicrobiales bacterium]